MKFVESRTELREVFGEASDTAVRKQLSRLDPHARRFLEKSCFVMIGTQDRNGNGDVTPKGDKPGFVVALNDTTIAIPDRPGNNRLDTWENILENPAVGLLFMIPGMNETLRINGEARLTFDAELCDRLGMNGRPAKAVLVVKLHQVYLHCAKAYIRSTLWQPNTWPDRSEMPTLGEIIKDQLAVDPSAEQIDEYLAENYRTDLW